MKGGWAVVIPSDSDASLALSAKSVLAAHPWMNPADILVITRALDGSALKTHETLGKLTYVKDPVEAFNYSRRANLGFAAAGDRDVVLMGDDVEVVTPEAFEAMKSEAPFRIVAAAVKGRVGPSWQREGQGLPEVPFVSFVCVYVPRAVYDMVGPLDEDFTGYGYEDTDYCMRGRKAGLSCGVCGNALVEHTVKIASTFMTVYGDRLPELEATAHRAFIRKWAWWKR
jgi:hypothetical protein